jgi:hypothetical protein
MELSCPFSTFFKMGHGGTFWDIGKQSAVGREGPRPVSAERKHRPRGSGEAQTKSRGLAGKAIQLRKSEQQSAADRRQPAVPGCPLWAANNMPPNVARKQDSRLQACVKLSAQCFWYRGETDGVGRGAWARGRGGAIPGTVLGDGGRRREDTLTPGGDGPGVGPLSQDGEQGVDR